jgi:hypothetical protein
MKKLKLIGLFAIGFILGAIVVSFWWQHLFSRMTVSKEVEVAAKTAFEAEWLAHLRLGDTKTAIENLERTMDIDIATISQWAEVSLPTRRRAEHVIDGSCPQSFIMRATRLAGMRPLEWPFCSPPFQAGIHKAPARAEFAGWTTYAEVSPTPALRQNET